MLKAFRLVSVRSAALGALVLAACSGNDEENDSDTTGPGGAGAAAAAGGPSGAHSGTATGGRASGGAAGTGTSDAGAGNGGAGTGGASGSGSASGDSSGGVSGDSSGGVSGDSSGGASGDSSGGMSGDGSGGASGDGSGGASGDSSGGMSGDGSGGAAGGQPTADGWLHTEGNQILDSDGNPFLGRGVNIGDTREAGACCGTDPATAGTVTTIKARVDTLADEWNATFLRLVLDIYDGECPAQSGDMVTNPAYRADVQEIVDHIGTKPGMYVMVSLHEHPANAKDHNGWVPDFTVQSTSNYGSLDEVYPTLVEMFCQSPHVILGVGNEPHNMDDDYVWTAMNTAVQTIRNAESSLGCPQHLVAVQGTQSWGRDLSYYVTHPIEAGDGANVIYETHSYDQRDDSGTAVWRNMFLDPAETLPVIVGEFGPYKECDVADCGNAGSMYYEDADELSIELERLHIPYTAWCYSGHLTPVMFYWVSGSANYDCSNPDGDWTGDISPWGEMMRARFAMPYGDDMPAYPVP